MEVKEELSNTLLADVQQRTDIDTPLLTRCTIKVVSTSEEFDKLEEEWNALIEQADGTVFQTFEWQQSWWKYFGSSHRLHCLVFHSGATTIGIAPLFTEFVRYAGVPLARRLQFIGRGLSDYLQVISLPGYEKTVLSALVQHLRSNSHEWDIFDLEDVNESSPSCSLLPALLREAGLPVYRYRGNVCPQVTLPTTAQMLMQSLGPTTGYNFRRKFKRLQSNFKSEVELYRRETDDLRAAVDAFCAIHGARWKSQGHPSAFDDDHHRAFHLEVVTKFAKRDWLRMFFLRIDGTPSAVSFSFNYKKRIYMYQSNAYGSEEVMKCSPGFLVRSIAMVEGISEGMQVFDFMRGDEPYKYKEWKASDTQNWLIRTASPRTFGRIRFRLYLLSELAGKSISRGIREYYEYRRFCLAKTPSPGQRAKYVGTKLMTLAGIGMDFIMRHSPALGKVVGPILERRNGEQASKNEHSAKPVGIRSRIISRARRYKINNIIHQRRVRRHGEHLVFKTESVHNREVRVVDSGRERQLILDNSTHSILFNDGDWSEARREYWGVILNPPFPLPPKATVLLCGLGGGTMLHLLRQDHPDWMITVLELDPVVVETARTHFGIDQQVGSDIIIGDAVKSMQKFATEGRTFDLLIDDVFFDFMAIHSTEEKELKQLMFSQLSPGGVIVFNRPIDSPHDEKKPEEFAAALRSEGHDVRTRAIRHRWWNTVIFCKTRVQ